jgi:hypothetical protein
MNLPRIAALKISTDQELNGYVVVCQVTASVFVLRPQAA